MVLARFRIRNENPDPIGYIKHPYWVWDHGDFWTVLAYEDSVGSIVQKWPQLTGGIDVLEDGVNDYKTMGHYL